MWMILFLALPILALVYVGWHLYVLLPLAPVVRWLIIVLGAGSFLLLMLDLTGKLDTMPLGLARVLYQIGTSSIIVLLYMVMLFLMLDIGRLTGIVPRHLLYQSWPMTVAVAGILLAIFVYGNIHYYNKVRVPIDIISAKPLPKDYKVVMASDLHLGYHNPRKELARWVDMINGEQPDLILIAGDIIDISVRPLLEEGMAEEFCRLSAPVYACLGNHEYYAGTPEARQFYKDASINLLIDEVAIVDSAIVIIGRDDRTNRRRTSLPSLVAKATAAATDAQRPLFTLLLDHQPYHLEQTERMNIDFQLSGHTHRGQVWPISWITDAIYECSWGCHRRGSTQYYISSGLGIWGGKYRIGTQSEYVVATIKHN